MVSILKPSVSAKKKKPPVNPCEHSSVMSKWTTVEFSLKLFCQKRHLAATAGLGSVASTKPGLSLGNLLSSDRGQFDIATSSNQVSFSCCMD